MKKSDFKISNQNESTIINENYNVPFITFSKLSSLGIKHGFSTRMGGVSKDHLSSMNLSFSRGDEETCVFENFIRMGNAIGFDIEQLVFSDQQHDTVIRNVTKQDAGKGIVKIRDYECVDGLVTNETGLCLATFYADCVPLFFYDPQLRVIGMAHSGWRGTAKRIGQHMIEKMKKDYGCDEKNIYAAIGPSICKECYEVSRDVYDAFCQEYPSDEIQNIFINKENNKFQLDLWKANEYVLKDAGITSEHLDVTDICTCCNPQLLFSHRATGGKRGNLAGFIMLDEL